MTEHLCVVCPQLRRGDPNVYEEPHVCQDCRNRLGNILTDIGDAWAALPAHLERGTGTGQRVRGGEVEAPLPFVEDVWDLLQPARPNPVHDPFGDQTGHVGVATILNSWAQDWAETRGMGERGVGGALWFRDRLDWACADHPAIDDFAAEMRDLLRAIRRFIGRETARAQPCVGVPCRRCDLKTLARLSNGSGDVECQNVTCRTVYRADEYQRWTRLVAASA